MLGLALSFRSEGALPLAVLANKCVPYSVLELTVSLNRLVIAYGHDRQDL